MTVVLCCFGAVSAVWLNARLGGTRAALDYDDVAEWAAAWLAAGSCLWAWRRGESRLRRFWLFLGVSAFAWGAGQAVWTYYEVALARQLPFPSLADVGYLAAVPLMVGALLSFPAAPARSLARGVMLLDGALVAAATLFVSWALVLGPVYRAHQGDVLAQAVTVAYPASDVLLVVVLLWVAVRASRSALLPLGLVASGVLALAFSDSAFAYLSQSAGYGSGLRVDIGWIAGFVLIATAPLWTRPEDANVRRALVERTSRVVPFVPYVPIAGALAVAVGYLATGRNLDTSLFAIGLATVALLAARQLLALLDSLSLNSRQSARFAALVQGSSDLTTILSPDGTIVYQSPSSLTLLGRAPDQLTGRPFQELVHPDDAADFLRVLAQVTALQAAEATVEWRLGHVGGEYRTVESHLINRLDDANVAGVTINSRDISERKRLEEELRDRALRDPLTGLPNRTLLADRLEHALAVQQRDDGHHDLAVVRIELDDFKRVNDALGHAVGDQLLQEVAGRLQSVVRSADTVARTGGDEFALVLDSSFSASDTDEAADRILDIFNKPFLLAGEEHLIRASVGITISNGEATDAARLLQEADIAMHAAKVSGKHRRETYKPGMHELVIERLQLEADLRHAVEDGQLAVFYQPIVDLGSGAMNGVEALMRWRHPTRGLLHPGAFIPAAEASGLIIPMGRWLLRRACRDVKSWDDLSDTCSLRLNVNLSARQLDDPDLAATVAAALEESELDPERLTLEITETAVLRDVESAVAILGRLKALGVELSIDDFGTGYSSLSYLRQLPVDELKIDRSFIIPLAESDEASNLVHTITRLAEDLHLRTVAEGVETGPQLDRLADTECELAQGYLFDPPLSARDLRRRLARPPRAAARPIARGRR